MISIIVCSKDLELLKGLSENIQETIGCKFELVAIDNRKSQYGICAAYNTGIKKAKTSFLCFVHGQVIHSFEGKEQLDRYGTLEKDCEVVVLDGLFLACRKEIAEIFRFNEALFKGFHFYDIDFCLRISQNFSNIVTYDILLKHFSGGNIGKEFQESRKKFVETYKLPYTKLKDTSKKKFPWQTFYYDSKKAYPRVLVGCPTS